MGRSGRDSSSPFKDYLSKHVQGRKHERARDKALAEVEAAVTSSGRTRAEIAMSILAQRAGLVPSYELPRAELQPVGSEASRSACR